MHIAGINPLNLRRYSGGHIPHFLAVVQCVYFVSVCTQARLCAKFCYIKPKTVFIITRAA